MKDVYKRAMVHYDNPWFTEEMLNLLSELAVTRVYWDKEIIYYQEEKADWCYYLKKGKVRIFVASEDGQEKTLAVYRSQTLFGEAAFLDGQPRTTTAVALSESEVLVIGKEHVLQCFREQPSLAWSIMSSLSQTIRMLSTQINQITFLSARERLIQFLIGEYEKGYLEISHTQEEIGAFIGSSRVTISRELNELKRKGILAIHYGKIQIVSVEELKKSLEKVE